MVSGGVDARAGGMHGVSETKISLTLNTPLYSEQIKKTNNNTLRLLIYLKVSNIQFKMQINK